MTRFTEDDSTALPATVPDYYKHVFKEKHLKPDSTLYLAVSAMSIAAFGRCKAIPGALSLAWKKYAKAIARTKVGVSDQGKATEDSFLLTILSLSHFEVRCVSTSNLLFDHA